ncbi:hypothetical protein CsSME_00003675 [Camellia sinensis var. sinensis]
MGLKGTTLSRSTMCRALMVVIIMLSLLTLLTPVDCRVLLPTTSTEKGEMMITGSETVRGFESSGLSSSSDSFDTKKSRVLVGNQQVYLMASGPSKKGPGH